LSFDVVCCCFFFMTRIQLHFARWRFDPSCFLYKGSPSLFARAVYRPSMTRIQLHVARWRFDPSWFLYKKSPSLSARAVCGRANFPSARFWLVLGLMRHGPALSHELCWCCDAPLVFDGPGSPSSFSVKDVWLYQLPLLRHP
jgi:hypothetical protein